MANQNRLIIMIVGGFLFIADRICKSISTSDITENHIFWRFFGWSPSTNTGIAFGLPVPQFIIIALSVIFIFLLLFYFQKNTSQMTRYGIFFILLGAISNLFDRIFSSQTFDYLFFFVSLFNIADILIVAGAAMCIFSSIKNPADN